MKNIKVMGEGTVGKGNFGKVTIMGEGEFIDDFSAERVTIYGEAILKKSFKIDKIKVFGEMEALEVGEITDEIRVYGEVEFNKDVKINRLSIKGEVSIKGNLNVGSTSIYGELNVEGDCEAEEFNCKGATEIKGLLNSDKVLIETFGKSKINEIGGASIKVKEGTSFLGLKRRGSLRCTSIEGDEIELVNTECKMVCGKDIIIGKGCTIQKIECTGTLIIDKNSEVKETVWKKD